LAKIVEELYSRIVEVARDMARESRQAPVTNG